jgi:hypothetical protein
MGMPHEYNAITIEGKIALAEGLSCNVSLCNLLYGLRMPAHDVYEEIDSAIEINRFRKKYLRQDKTTISPALYPHIFARVSQKPSALFLFLLENQKLLYEECLSEQERVLVPSTTQELKGLTL